MEFIPTWLAVTVISRDVLITLGILFLLIYRMEIRIRPSIISKITTCLQFLTVIGILSSGAGLLDISEGIFRILFQLTGLFTISSGLHYIHAWFRMMGEGDGQEGSPKEED
jgi:cardiolipin synthase